MIRLLLFFALLGDTDQERFLATARIESVAAVGKGVTRPLKAILHRGAERHPAQIQTVDKELPPFFGEAASGPPIPMFDRWRYNVAAYRLSRMLGMDCVPVSIARVYRGKPAAFTWWIEDIAMDEGERRKRSLPPPPEARYNDMLVFDELILNIDRNLGNLLYTRDGRMILIDHTRSFTPYHGIRNRANLKSISLGLRAALQRLSRDQLTARIGTMLSAAEIDALLERRDLILEALPGN